MGTLLFYTRSVNLFQVATRSQFNRHIQPSPPIKKFDQLFYHADMQLDATLRFHTSSMLCLHVDLVDAAYLMTPKAFT